MSATRLSKGKRIVCRFLWNSTAREFIAMGTGVLGQRGHKVGHTLDHFVHATLNHCRHLRTLLPLCSLLVSLLLTHGLAQSNSSAAKSIGQPASKERDGRHDFDFEIGKWKTHLSRLLHPLTGSAAWVEYDGTSVIRKIWNGGANLVELDVEGPAGHIEGLSLRLYNPQAHQWSLNFANSSGGALSQPTIGEFRNGRGEFFDQEQFNGRTILVRNVFSDITPDSYRFEQAYSDDGGKAWEVNWIAVDTRVKE
jgi:hypothetical protein